MSLPGASELFRPTQPADADPTPGAPAESVGVPPADQTLPASGVGTGTPAAPAGEVQPTLPAPSSRRTPVAPLSRPSASGRVRHDEKITVYVSADELMALEEARLTLRRQGVAVDRGRIVRAAIALAMADLHEHGGEGDLVAHLMGS